MHGTSLSYRAVLSLQGPDRISFLKGLITNDLEENKGPFYAALLTPQGKFEYDLFLVDDGQTLWMDVDAQRSEDLQKRLLLFKLRSHILLTSQPEYCVYAFWPAQIGDLLDLPKPVPFKTIHLYADPRLPTLGLRGFGPASLEKDLGEWLGSGKKTEKDYHLFRIQQGVPDGSYDLIPQRSFILDYGFDALHAISWTKGCYMGQELNARMHYQNLVRKHLFPIHLSGPAPSLGTPIYLNDQKVGEIRSVVDSFGLAILRLEAWQKWLHTQEPFNCDQATLTPHTPLWMDQPLKRWLGSAKTS